MLLFFLLDFNSVKIEKKIVRQRKGEKTESTHYPPQSILQNHDKDIDKDKDSPDRKQTGRPLECNRHSMLKPHSYGHLIFNQGIKNMD